jgi:prevent-host-death family protein
METVISKSKFKPKALQYFREIEKTGKQIIITSHGKPVLKIIPFSDHTESILASLRDTVKKFEGPTEPVGLQEWEALQ